MNYRFVVFQIQLYFGADQPILALPYARVSRQDGDAGGFLIFEPGSSGEPSFCLIHLYISNGHDPIDFPCPVLGVDFRFEPNCLFSSVYISRRFAFSFIFPWFAFTFPMNTMRFFRLFTSILSETMWIRALRFMFLFLFFSWADKLVLPDTKKPKHIPKPMRVRRFRRKFFGFKTALHQGLAVCPLSWRESAYFLFPP